MSTCLPALTGLTYHANLRRKFGVRLRRTWDLHVGGLRTLTCDDEQTAKQKVHGYQRVCMGEHRMCEESRTSARMALQHSA